MVEQLLKDRKTVLHRKQAENDLMDRQATEAEDEMVEAVEKLQDVQDSLQFVEWVANSRRGAKKSQIEKAVSSALKLVYGPDYAIELSYSMKNNRSNLDIELVRKTEAGDVRRGMDGFGGGVADTISVPLRLLVVSSSKQTDKVCLLDECYRHVDPERVPLVAEFLDALCQELGFQVILCSHHEQMREKADRTFVTKDVGGKSEIEDS